MEVYSWWPVAFSPVKTISFFFFFNELRSEQATVADQKLAKRIGLAVVISFIHYV